MKLILIAFLSLFAGVTQATPVTWTLNNATFSDGTTLTGSFVYDAGVNSYSDVNLVTSWWDYGASGVVNYDSTSSRLFVTEELEFSLGNQCEFRDISSSLSCFELNLYFAESLTSAGGTVNFFEPPYYSAELEYDFLNNSSGRGLVSGSVSAVPIPAAVWLFGSALAGLGWMRRKQST